MSRIEQVIAEIEDYIEDCRPTAFSASKIVVQKEELQEKLSELRMAIPEELDKSKRILNNQNNIIMDAQARYNTMVNEASKKNQSEIVQKATATANEILASARAQAQSIVDAAQAEANGIRLSSIQYTDQLLLNVQNIIGNASRESEARNQALQAAFRQSFDQIAANRQQLAASNESAQAIENQRKEFAFVQTLFIHRRSKFDYRSTSPSLSG